MNDKKISMLAIAYLSQVAHAIFSQLVLRAPGASEAAKAGMDCTSSVNVILGTGTDTLSLDRRMDAVAETMSHLAAIFREHSSLLTASGQSIPSLSEIEKLKWQAEREAAAYCAAF